MYGCRILPFNSQLGEHAVRPKPKGLLPLPRERKPTIRLIQGICLALLLVGCGSSNKDYRLVSTEYNFSILFPDGKPTEKVAVNDEGLPRKDWEWKRDAGVTTGYYHVGATCYKETLKPDDELVPNPALLASAGIRLLASRRTQIASPARGRRLEAIYTTTHEQSTGVTLSNLYVVDGRCLLSASTRLNGDPAKNSLFLSSFTILR